MIRLTYERVNGIKTGYWSPNTKEELVQHLAAYENTGLEPKDIENNKWIPCRERLPEDENIVLVTTETKKGLRNVNRAYCIDGFWHGNGSMARVIAWMPLPEPYDDEGGLNEE